MTTAHIEVEVDLSDFSDQDIKEEYAERFGTPMGNEDDDTQRLQSIYHAMRQGKPDAQDMMWDYIRDRLGTVV
jgi:hypothetical protein